MVGCRRMNKDLELNDLEQFRGTEKYTNVMGVNVTEGINYIMNNGYSWLVTDFIVVAKMKAKLRNEPFLTIHLIINLDDTAEMVVTDGNKNRLYAQEYKYTDAKTEVKLFFTDNVLMLAGEYQKMNKTLYEHAGKLYFQDKKDRRVYYELENPLKAFLCSWQLKEVTGLELKLKELRI